jgi:hypothetical protein
MSWMSELFRRSADGEAIRVLGIVASRAVYSDPDVKERVEVRIKVEGGYKLTLDMNITQCTTLIQQLTAAHDAINPPLRSQLGGTRN